MVLKTNGTVWATGYNYWGQLGDGTTTDRRSFVKVVSSGVTAIAGGYAHSIVLKKDGSVWTTGYNENGQLGDGTTTERHGFVKAKCPGCVTTSAVSRVRVQIRG